MRTLFFCIISFLLIFISEASRAQEFAFSTTFGQRLRLGNGLFQYALSVFLSEKYHKPFIYNPFKHSDKLLLHTEVDPRFDTYQRVELRKENDINYILKHSNNENVIFCCNCKTRFNIDKNFLPDCHIDERIIATISQNSQVVHLLRERIQPIKPISKINNQGLPCIALHIRTGGFFQEDRDFVANQSKILQDITYQETNNGYMCKFIQFIGYEFYFRAIKLILKELNNSKCYIYIFTDDDQPEKILNIFQKKFKNQSIIFDCRKVKNNHDLNVVEDFFAMIQFDYFIRPFSTYTQMIQMLGKHKKVIYPTKMVIRNGTINVQRINIVINSSQERQIIQVDFNQLP